MIFDKETTQLPSRTALTSKGFGLSEWSGIPGLEPLNLPLRFLRAVVILFLELFRLRGGDGFLVVAHDVDIVQIRESETGVDACRVKSEDSFCLDGGCRVSITNFGLILI